MSRRDAPLYVEAHDLARWTLAEVRSWGERGELHLAARVTDAVAELLCAISLALTFPATRAADLIAADRTVVRLRVLLRLGRDLGLLSASGLRFASGRLEVAGRMIGGWRRRVEPEGSPGGRRLLTKNDSGDGP